MSKLHCHLSWTIDLFYLPLRIDGQVGQEANVIPERPGTAPPGMLVHEMRSARELAKKYQFDHAIMQANYFLPMPSLALKWENGKGCFRMQA